MASNVRALPGLNFDFTANVARFHTDMDKAVRITENTIGKIQNSVGKLSGAFAALGGGLLFGEVLRQAADAEKKMAQLEAGVRSTGMAAGLSAKQLSEMANALEAITDFDDDDIKGAESILLTFTKIGKEAFPQAIKSTLDLAAKFGTDLPSAAMQLGKALQDPIAGITALKRAGVSFSETQKAMMKDMVAHGDLLSAQKMIFKELSIEVGGSAEAMRNTLGGSMNAVQRSFQDVLKEIGLSESEGLRGAMNGISKALDFAAEHAVVLTHALEGVAAAAAVMTAARIPALIGQISTALMAASTRLGAFGIAGLAIAGVVGTLVAVRDETFNVAGHTVTLENIVRSLGNLLGQVWNQALEDMKRFAGQCEQVGKLIMKAIAPTVTAITKQFAQWKPLIDKFIEAVKIATGMKGMEEIFKLEPIKDFTGAWKEGFDEIIKDAEKLTKEQQKAKKEAAINPRGPGGIDPTAEQMKHTESFKKWMQEQEAKVAGLTQELAGHKDIGKILEARLQLEARIGKLSDEEVKKVDAILKKQQQLQHVIEVNHAVKALNERSQLMDQEISKGKIAAEIARERAQLEDKIGQLTVKEAKALEEAIVHAKALETIKQLQEQHKTLEGQKAPLLAELAGHKELVPLLQLEAQLEQQGVFEALKHAKTTEDRRRIMEAINKVARDTVEIQRAQASLQTKNTMDGLDQQIAKQQDVIRLGKEWADIEDQVRNAIKANPWITPQELNMLRQKVRLTQQLQQSQAAMDALKGMQEQSKEMEFQVRQKFLMTQHADQQAKYEALIYEYEKRTNLQASEAVKNFARKQAGAQQLASDMQKALGIIESTKTATEKYQDEVAELNRLYQQGLLTLDQYQKAVSNISPAFQRFKDIAKGVGDALSGALDDWLLKGGKFTDVLKNLGKELISLIAKKALLEPLSNWISGGITNIGRHFFQPGGSAAPAPTFGSGFGGMGPMTGFNPMNLPGMGIGQFPGLQLPGMSWGGFGGGGGVKGLSPSHPMSPGFNGYIPGISPGGFAGMGSSSGGGGGGWTSKTGKIATFANGGAFSAGQMMMVGERGPEMMMAGGPGQVIPNHDLASLGFFQPDDDLQIAQFSLTPMLQRFAGMFSGMSGMFGGGGGGGSILDNVKGISRGMRGGIGHTNRGGGRSGGGIMIGDRFFPGWGTLSDARQDAADNLFYQGQFKQANGMGAMGWGDQVLANRIMTQDHLSMFAPGTIPVSPSNFHNYNGPPQNLAESFGLNAQNAALYGQGGGYGGDMNPWGHQGNWTPGLTGWMNGSNAHQYNNGIDMGRQNQAPYAGLTDFNRHIAQNADWNNAAVWPSPYYSGTGHPDSRLMHRQPDGSYSPYPPPPGPSYPPPGSYNPVNSELNNAYQFQQTGSLLHRDQVQGRLPASYYNFPVPQFANGGSFDGTGPIKVGERGPEMILPKAAGSVIPNHNLKAFAPSAPNIVINNNREATEVTATPSPDFKEINVTVEKMVANSLRNGQAGKVLRKDYGAQRRGAAR